MNILVVQSIAFFLVISVILLLTISWPSSKEIVRSAAQQQALFQHANPVTQSTLNKSLFHLTRVAYLKVESLTKTALASVLDTEVVQLWFAV